MNEDPEEIVFHVSMIAVLLRSLKLLSGPDKDTETRAYTAYPLISQMVGLCLSLTQYPHLESAAVALSQTVSSLVQIQGKRSSTWPEVEDAHRKLLETIKSPIPSWVRKNLAIVDAPGAVAG